MSTDWVLSRETACVSVLSPAFAISTCLCSLQHCHRFIGWQCTSHSVGLQLTSVSLDIACFLQKVPRIGYPVIGSATIESAFRPILLLALTLIARSLAHPKNLVYWDFYLCTPYGQICPHCHRFIGWQYFFSFMIICSHDATFLSYNCSFTSAAFGFIVNNI